MARASRAGTCLHEDDFLEGLDGLADLVGVRHSLQALRPEQQLHAWASYADELESRLQLVHQQLVGLRMERVVHEIVRRQAGCDVPAAPGADDGARKDCLELLARVRAEQLMTVRLLNLLARCERLDVLPRVQGEIASVLDGCRRRELRAADFEECLAELQALRDAKRDELTRAREGAGARRLSLPGYSRRTAVNDAAAEARTRATPPLAARRANDQDRA
jgi:hypothetical protein